MSCCAGLGLGLWQGCKAEMGWDGKLNYLRRYLGGAGFRYSGREGENGRMGVGVMGGIVVMAWEHRGKVFVGTCTKLME